MDAKTAERPEVQQPFPIESAPLPPQEDTSLRAKFKQFIDYGLVSFIETPARKPNIPSVADLGRAALVKWQSRDPEKSWRPRSPWFGRLTTALGGTAVITAATVLLPRSAQAYAMARHGMHFGAEYVPEPTDSILSADAYNTAAPRSNGLDTSVGSLLHAPTLKSTGNAMPQAHLASGTTDEWTYTSGAKTISRGEGWYHQFRQMGIRGNDSQLRGLLNDVGHTLHNRGVAYYDHDAREWRMRLVDPNSSGSGYHHATGNGGIRERDLDLIMDEAADHKLVEHHIPDTDNKANTTPGHGSAEHKHPPTEPAPPSAPPEQHKNPNPDLGKPSVEVKDVSWVEASENWVQARWNEMIDTWEHFVSLDMKEAGQELKNAWSSFWGGEWLKVAGVGTILFAMKQYENGRRAIEAAYPGKTLLRTGFREYASTSPATWRSMEWQNIRRQPAAVRERPVPFSWSPRTWWRRGKWQAVRRPVVVEEETAPQTVPVSTITPPAGPAHRRYDT